MRRGVFGLLISQLVLSAMAPAQGIIEGQAERANKRLDLLLGAFLENKESLNRYCCLIETDYTTLQRNGGSTTSFHTTVIQRIESSKRLDSVVTRFNSEGIGLPTGQWEVIITQKGENKRFFEGREADSLRKPILRYFDPFSMSMLTHDRLVLQTAGEDSYLQFQVGEELVSCDELGKGVLCATWVFKEKTVRRLYFSDADGGMPIRAELWVRDNAPEKLRGVTETKWKQHGDVMLPVQFVMNNGTPNTTVEIELKWLLGAEVKSEWLDIKAMSSVHLVKAIEERLAQSGE